MNLVETFPGLYIHVPFCIKKCKYCDFVSYTGMENEHEKYVDALLEEAEKYKNTKVDTVFIGGGTPTCLAPATMDRLLEGIRKIFCILPDAEFSVEANPGTVSDEKLRILKNSGVNRLSIGVQSFDDEQLKLLGRIHDKSCALKTIENANKYFSNINIDIMTAIPHQSAESLMATLQTAVNTGAKHLSCYSLIIEDGTEFHKLYSEGCLELCTEDEDRSMFSELCGYLAQQGYERYEISNFAKDGARCRHNMKYWKTEEYIGLGAAAHSYMDFKRYYNFSDLKKYISSPGVPEEVIELSIDDRMSEYVIMALRTSDGVSYNEFKNRFGKNFNEVYPEKLKKYEKFLKQTPDGFALTDCGFDISNSIMCQFIL